jgi:polar amino acid transport system substrate-binding protein
MKKIIACMLALVMGCVCLTGCQSKDEFVLGFDEGFPPMGYIDTSDNTHKGFDLDVAKEVCKRWNVTLKLQPIDWNSKEIELKTGTIDCIWNGFTVNAEREKVMSFSDPYLKNRQVLVVKGDSAYKTQDDLKGKTVALQNGSSAADALDANADFKKSIKGTLMTEDNVDALLNLDVGQADAVLLDEVVARYYINKLNKNYRVLDKSFADEEYAVGFRKDDTELVKKFNQTMNEMKEDGTLSKISEEWFGEDIVIK